MQTIIKETDKESTPNFDFSNLSVSRKDLVEDVENINKQFEAEQTTYTGDELFKINTASIPSLVEPIIPSTGVWALVGSSDTGKSMLLRQLALDLAKGKSFLGFPINVKYQKVIFVATEDDHVSTSYLIRKQSASADFLENIRFHFETENIEEYLFNELTKDPADLVIIDAWSDVFGQNLNDSALIRQTLNKYRTIANKFGCSIGFLHHTGKRTEKLEPSKNNILSGQGFEAKMRLVIELRSDVGNENLKHLCIVKGNYLGKEYKSESYVLDFDPETFLFTNTGKRVPFDQLAAPTEAGGKKRNTPFNEFDESVHRELIKSVFRNEQQLTFRPLWESLSNAYTKKTGEVFGRDRSQLLVRYLVDEGYISKEGKEKASVYELKKQAAA